MFNTAPIDSVLSGAIDRDCLCEQRDADGWPSRGSGVEEVMTTNAFLHPNGGKRRTAMGEWRTALRTHFGWSGVNAPLCSRKDFLEPYDHTKRHGLTSFLS
eukprot:gene8305-5820_t